MDRFADIFDLAQAHIECETELRIERIRQIAQDGTGMDYCVDCGEKIPPGRRLHVPNARRCVSCQGLFERS
jgi:phage/conjugal plasmid C-4 type zinc finger TraR family protein